MILLNLIFWTTLASANGHVIPNAGNFVRCPAEKATDGIFANGLALEDVYELRYGQNKTYKTLRSFRGQSLETAFPKAVKKFFGRSPYTMNVLLKHFAQRSKELRFSNRSLRMTSVPSFAVWGRGCEVVTVAVQYSSLFPSRKPLSIEISQSLWNQMATDQKISLLFHEYLFGDQYAIGNRCAYVHVIALNGWILSDEAVSSDWGAWNEHINFDCDRLSGHPR